MYYITWSQLMDIRITSLLMNQTGIWSFTMHQHMNIKCDHFTLLYQNIRPTWVTFIKISINSPCIKLYHFTIWEVLSHKHRLCNYSYSYIQEQSKTHGSGGEVPGSEPSMYHIITEHYHCTMDIKTRRVVHIASRIPNCAGVIPAMARTRRIYY